MPVERLRVRMQANPRVVAILSFTRQRVVPGRIALESKNAFVGLCKFHPKFRPKGSQRLRVHSSTTRDANSGPRKQSEEITEPEIPQQPTTYAEPIQNRARTAYEAAQDVVSQLKRKQSLVTNSSSDEITFSSETTSFFSDGQGAPPKWDTPVATTKLLPRLERELSMDEANEYITQLHAEASAWQLAHATAQVATTEASQEAYQLRQQLQEEKTLHMLLSEDLQFQTDMIKELAGLASEVSQQSDTYELNAVTRVTAALAKQAETARNLDDALRAKSATEGRLQGTEQLLSAYETEIENLKSELDTLLERIGALEKTTLQQKSPSTSETELRKQMESLQVELKSAREGSVWKEDYLRKEIESTKTEAQKEVQTLQEDLLVADREIESTKTEAQKEVQTLQGDLSVAESFASKLTVQQQEMQVTLKSLEEAFQFEESKQVQLSRESEAKQASLGELIQSLQGELSAARDSSQKKEIFYQGQIDQVQEELTAEESKKRNLW